MHDLLALATFANVVLIHVDLTVGDYIYLAVSVGIISGCFGAAACSAVTLPPLPRCGFYIRLHFITDWRLWEAPLELHGFFWSFTLFLINMRFTNSIKGLKRFGEWGCPLCTKSLKAVLCVGHIFFQSLSLYFQSASCGLVVHEGGSWGLDVSPGWWRVAIEKHFSRAQHLTCGFDSV